MENEKLNKINEARIFSNTEVWEHSEETTFFCKILDFRAYVVLFYSVEV